MGKKIGFMGGTFNPVHIGHLLLAECARVQENLDQVLFIPSGISYMKKDVEIPAGEVRLDMVDLAIGDNPYFSSSDIEIRRQGYTYTKDTLKKLRAANPDDTYYFIVGADSLFGMDAWKNPEEIFDNCIVLAAVRGLVSKEEILHQIDLLEKKYDAKIKLLEFPATDISSTQIRGCVREHKSIRYMVRDDVAEYIYENHLYESHSCENER